MYPIMSVNFCSDCRFFIFFNIKYFVQYMAITTCTSLVFKSHLYSISWTRELIFGWIKMMSEYHRHNVPHHEKLVVLTMVDDHMLLFRRIKFIYKIILFRECIIENEFYKSVLNRGFISCRYPQYGSFYFSWFCKLYLGWIVFHIFFCLL